MKIHPVRIPYRQTNSFNDLTLSYLDKQPFLNDFYTFAPNWEGLEKKTGSRNYDHGFREILVKELKYQYDSAGITPSLQAESNLQNLLLENCFTVTTGHQLNLLSGPLYVIYKLISTIRLSRMLAEKFPDKKFVPVFWMATEDHDIDEINHLHLFGKKISYETTYKGPAGKLPLTDFANVIAELTEVLGDSTFATELSNILKQAYSNEVDLAVATRRWTNALLGKYGLIIIDGSTPALKKLFINEFKNELQNQSSFNLVSSTINKLTEKFSAQVSPREINLFYLGQNSRNRIVRESGRFKVLDTEISFSEDEILRQVDTHPELFSPNVILRPLYQEKILPNIAYIGGPAEIAYWLELKSVFDHHAISFPVLLLRNCALIADSSLTTKISKLGLKTTDFFRPTDELVKEYVLGKNSDPLPVQQYSGQIESLFSDMTQRVMEIDASLKGPVEAEKQKLLNAISNLEQKAIRALKKKEETEISRITTVKDKLFPNNVLQERSESFLQFYLRWGREFFEILLNEFDPVENQFLILEEESAS